MSALNSIASPRVVAGGLAILAAGASYLMAKNVYKACTDIAQEIDRSPNNRWLTVAKICVIIGNLGMGSYLLFGAGSLAREALFGTPSFSPTTTHLVCSVAARCGMGLIVLGFIIALKMRDE